MTETKRARYAAYSAELDRAGIDYVPVVWSCWGRPHARTSAILREMAQRAACRRGGDAKEILRRVQAQIGTELCRRAARMLRACWPRHAGAEGS
eukprot:903761-Karenia_brevis.AAC.1